MRIEITGEQEVAGNAQSLNFDGLVYLFTVMDEPRNIRRSLQDLYFKIVQILGKEDDIFHCLVDDLYTIKLLIEATEDMVDHD